ncbi:MAG: tRNA (adenosine(37)-N6)-dimethylallyltransferase MiaA [Bacteroidales bacterium]
MSKNLVVLAGPTAVGKTTTGIELASRYGSEIVSADSRQIYKECSIGTAVPSPAELAAVPHHFIQCRSLNEYYNASMYEAEVLERLHRLFEKKELVFMVGGSGLYINAVCFGIDDLPTIDQNIRDELAAKFREEGIESIRQELKRLDPVTYSKTDLNNHFRILKALEVTVQTGRPYSSFLTRSKKKRNFRIIRLALDMERDELYNRINKRVERMIGAGLVDEVRGLEKFRGKNAMKTVGYREIISYLDNQISLEEAVDLIKRNTRKYARKQLTWFRKDDIYPWFHPDETEKMVQYINSQLTGSNTSSS